MLRLEAERTAAAEGCSVLAFVAVCPVVGVELHARFGGIDLHGASAFRLRDFGGERKLAWLALVEHIAMVVAGAVLDLLAVGVVDALAHGVRLREIKRCALHAADFARRDRVFVDGHEEIGVDLAHHIHCRGSGVGDTCEREEAVARHVHHRLLVGRSLIVDNEFVVVGQRVHHGHRQLAGEALLIIRRHVAQHERMAVDLLCVPHAGVKSRGAAVQVVRPVVHGEVVLLAVEREATLADAVAVAAYERAEERFGRIEAVVDIIVSLDNVGIVAVAVGHHDSHERAAVVGNGHFHAVFISQEKQIYGLAVDFLLEILSFEPTLRGGIVFHKRSVLID